MGNEEDKASDVARFVRDYQEIVYTIGPEAVRKAVLAWLTDEHAAAFTDDTTLKFCTGGSIAVTTRFSGSGVEGDSAVPKGNSDAI